MKKQPKYATEADLCAAFIESAKRAKGWTAYAETAGWDILLAHTDGAQIGIEAKLRLNLKVLQQALPERWEHWHDSGPDYRAILIPDRDHGFDALTDSLGLVVFAPNYRDDFTPGLEYIDHWHWWSPRKRCKLPDYVPDVVAGASGPIQLTEWKVKALRIVATLEIRGFVTRADFKQHSVDPRSWTGPNGWLVTNDRPGEFVRGPRLEFDKQHPEVYAKVLADVRAELDGESVPRSAPVKARQDDMFGAAA